MYIDFRNGQVDWYHEYMCLFISTKDGNISNSLQEVCQAI